MPGRGAELAMIIRARDDGVSAVFGGARKSVETFASAAAAASRTTSASMAAMGAASRGVQTSFTAVTTVSRSMVTSFTGISVAAKSTTGSLGTLSTAAKATVSGLQTEVSKLTKLTAAAAAAGGTALAGGLGVSVKQAADFEKTMSGVAAVSGASAAQMKQLSDLALKLGADTSFSATEAGKGIEELVKAGVSLADVMGGAAKASLDLAAAGGISVADAATIASNAMNQFGIKGSQMGHVADLIAGAANASAIDVGQFGLSLQAAGAVAATVGFSFDDLADAIAIMGQAGVTGSDAGTSLKTMMLALQPQTKEQTELFKKLGLITKDGANAFFDASGKVKSMADVAQILQEALRGQSEQQKIATLQTLFGTDAVRAAAIMSKAGASGFREMATAMGKVSAADVAEKRLDNLSGSVEKFKGSLSTAAITIGSAFLPFLRRIVDGATSLLNSWMPTIQAFAEKIPAALDKLVAKAGALAPAIGRAFGGLGDMLGDLVGNNLDAVIDTLIELGQGALGAIPGILASIRSAIPAVLGAFQSLVPVALSIGRAYLDNLVTTFQFIVYRVIPPLLSIVQQTARFFLGTLQPALTTTAGVMRGILGDTLDWLASTAWPPLLEIAGQTARFWTGVMLPAIQRVAPIFRTVLGESIKWLADVGWPALLSAATVVVNYLSGTVAPMLPGLARTIRDGLGGAIQWIATTGWPTFISTATQAMTTLTSTVLPAITDLVMWLREYVPPAINWIVNTGWPALVAAGEAVTSWMQNTAIPAIGALVDWLGPKVSAVVNWLTTTGWPTLVSAADALSAWIDDTAAPALAKLVEWIGPKVSTVVSWLTNTGWPTLVDAATKVSDWIANTAIPKLTDLWSWLEEKLTPVVQWFIDEGWPNLQKLGDQVVVMWTSMSTWVQDVWTKLGQLGVWDDLESALKDLWDAGKILVETFWPDMKKGATEVYDPTNTWLILLKGGSLVLKAFAAGVDAVALAIKAIKEQIDAWPEWLKDVFKRGAIQAALPGIGGPISNIMVPPTGITQRQSGSTSSPYSATSWEGKAFAAAQKAGHPNPMQFVEQMRWESAGFDPDVISGKRASSAGALGIAQIMPGVARSAGVNALDPEAALAYAAKRMADAYVQYGGNSEKALASYNMGAGNLERYGARGLPETNKYIDMIDQRTAEAVRKAGMDGARATGGTAGIPNLSSMSSINQFSLTSQGLSWDDAASACGPAALLSFWKATGRTPDATEAMQIARASGWTRAGGMNGVGNFMKMLGAAGVRAALDQTPTDQEIQASLAAGNPVAFSNTKHYFMATGYDQATGKYNVGGSGLALKGGSEWMSLDDIAKLSGPLTATITMFADLATAVQDTGDTAQTSFLAMSESVDGANESVRRLHQDTVESGQAAAQLPTQVAEGSKAAAGQLKEGGKEWLKQLLVIIAAGEADRQRLMAEAGKNAGAAYAKGIASGVTEGLGSVGGWFTPGKGNGKGAPIFAPSTQTSPWVTPLLPPHRAMGGPVAAGLPYWVGEQGPEVFVPGRSGGIVPNGGLGRGGQTVIVNLNAGTIVHERELPGLVREAFTQGLRG